MENCKIVTKLDRNKWSLFINSHPHGNIFQTLEMYKVYQDTKKYKPVFLAVVNNVGEISGTLLAVIQKEYSGVLGNFTARSIIHGGPLIKDDDPTVLDFILKEYDKIIKKKVIYSQFRNFWDWREKKEIFQKYNCEYLEHLNFIVDCRNRDHIKKEVSKSKLRQIKKSKKEGAKIIEPLSIEQVSQFYDVLKHLYKEKVKKPLPDWSLFEKFYYRKDVGRYFLIEYKSKIIGGIMCPIFNKKVIYEWFVCGLDGKYKRIYPSVLATWAAIDYANFNNIDVFDFMGAGKPDQDYGVRDFKSKFGGQLVNYGRFEKVHKEFLMRIGKLGLKIYRGRKFWFTQIKRNINKLTFLQS